MTQLKQAQLKEILGGLSMSTQRNRAALLAGLLILALSPPALAADVDVANPPPSASDEAQLALLSPTAQGPIIVGIRHRRRHRSRGVDRPLCDRRSLQHELSQPVGAGLRSEGAVLGVRASVDFRARSGVVGGEAPREVP